MRKSRNTERNSDYDRKMDRERNGIGILGNLRKKNYKMGGKFSRNIVVKAFVRLS